MKITDIKAILDESLGTDSIIKVDESSTPTTLVTLPAMLPQLMLALYQDQRLLFDMLSCLTGIDNGPEINTMEVIYNLYSIPLERSLMVKVSLDRDSPEIQTVSNIWRTADWHERETYDLLGIIFVNHPDLRRILMPADWEGFPLRKDYKEPHEYRGMKTIREEGNPS